jgi:hypothetical protein
MVWELDTMATLKGEFDGRVFVPCEEVKLAAGTKVEVFVPASPRPATAEENREWHEILQELASSPPAFVTVEDALRYASNRP